MIEVEVMYADLSRVRVPIADAATLPRDGVLFVILSAPDADRPRLNGYRRCAEKFGLDYYYLLFRDGLAHLGGWNDREYRWVPLEDPFKPERMSLPPWLPADVIVFGTTGAALSSTEWDRALALFYAEMH